MCSPVSAVRRHYGHYAAQVPVKRMVHGRVVTANIIKDKNLKCHLLFSLSYIEAFA